MRVLRYLWQGKKLLVYIVLGAVISAAMSLILWDFGDPPIFFKTFAKIFALSVLLLILLRCADDHSDYEKDAGEKEQPLSKRGILYVMLVVAAVFVTLNILLYLLLGLCSLLVLGYLLVQQKVQFLKMFFLPTVSAYYFYLNRISDLPYPAIGIYLAVCLILSVGFYIFKRRRAK